MKKLLNTLYILSEDTYLALNGETVEILFSDDTKKNIPLCNLESIVCFSYKGASPALMGKCAENDISLSFFTPHGRYLANSCKMESGNVLIRREQFRIADNDEKSLCYAKDFLIGKLYNSKYVLLRCARDHGMQSDTAKLRETSEKLTEAMSNMQNASDMDILRGLEGKASADYFGCFNELILKNKEDFAFSTRSRRPPLDNINALLSFVYTLLANNCASALQSVGLDPFVGFMHTSRPGRKSLALDLMEELRSVCADRFAVTLINNRIINGEDFEKQESGAVLMSEEARKKLLSEWQKRKKEEITHPFLGEKIEWGLVPYVQATLLARTIRGDLDRYPPFFWK